MKEGWNVKKLDELFDVKSSKRVHKSDWKNSGVPFYRAREVVKLAQNGKVNNDLFISEELFEEFTKDKGAPNPGDIIISAVGTLGQCYIVKDQDRFYFKDASVLWFEKISNVDTRYIEYAFRSNLIKKQVMHQSMGATVGTLTISRAKRIRIPVPPLEEQQQIVQILDQAFEKIDRAINHIERNIKNTEELFQSKLNEIFSKKGEGWEEKTLIEVSKEFGRGKSKHRPRNDESLFGGEYPFIQTGDIRSAEKFVHTFSKSYNQKGLAQSKLWKKGTLCITIAANIAETAILEFDGCFPDSVIGMVADEQQADIEFTFYALQYLKTELKKLGKGSAQDNINLGTFKNLHFPFPDVHTQKSLVITLDNLKSHLGFYKEKLNEKSILLESLKKSLLEKAFKGELIKEEVTHED